MTVRDVVLRYAERADPADRFAELGEPLAEVREEPPRAFPQAPGGLGALLGGANGEVPQDEDAFQVRIQAPDDADGLPVVVFVPGGGFLTGTANARWFTAPDLVSSARIVLVTVNHRLGALGMLGAGDVPDPRDAQRPLRDVETALRWVRAHIGAFGGDADRVTLAGDSAGAWIAFALATLERTRGLFTRLALISLPWDPPFSAAAYADRAAVVRDALGDESIERAPVGDVLRAQGALARAFAGRGAPMLPAADGELDAGLHDFASSAARLHVASLALLSTSDEATAFLLPAPEEAFPPPTVDGFVGGRFEDPAAVTAWIDAKLPDATPKRRMAEAMTLHQFRLAHLELAAAATAAGIRVDVAAFDVPSAIPGVGSTHCLPLPFLFGDRGQWADAPMLEGIDDAVFARASRALQDWFVGAARDGAASDGARALEPFDPARPLRWTIDADGASAVAPGEAHLRAVRD